MAFVASLSGAPMAPGQFEYFLSVPKSLHTGAVTANSARRGVEGEGDGGGGGSKDI
jgi:hypothetical protein